MEKRTGGVDFFSSCNNRKPKPHKPKNMRITISLYGVKFVATCLKRKFIYILINCHERLQNIEK
jgi:hypothetical protein